MVVEPIVSVFPDLVIAVPEGIFKIVVSLIEPHSALELVMVT